MSDDSKIAKYSARKKKEMFLPYDSLIKTSFSFLLCLSFLQSEINNMSEHIINNIQYTWCHLKSNIGATKMSFTKKKTQFSLVFYYVSKYSAIVQQIIHIFLFFS